MDKIYQKMYLPEKSHSKDVLDDFIDNVILRSFNAESQPFGNLKWLGCRVKASRHDGDIRGCRVKTSRYDDNIRGCRVKASRHDGDINPVILRRRNSGSQFYFFVLKRLFFPLVIPEGCNRESPPYNTAEWLRCRVKTSRHDGDINPVILRRRNSGSYPYFTKHAGFTLIELLVVVLIIGILAAIVVPQYQTAVTKAKAVKVISLMSQINRSQELYYMNNALYAEDPRELDFTFPAGAELDSDGRWVYKDFSCKLCVDKSNGKCIAMNCLLSNGRGSLSFVLYYYNSPHSNKFFCSAPIVGTNAEIIDLLCKNMGFTHPYGTGRWYKLANE